MTYQLSKTKAKILLFFTEVFFLLLLLASKKIPDNLSNDFYCLSAFTFFVLLFQFLITFPIKIYSDFFLPQKFRLYELTFFNFLLKELTNFLVTTILVLPFIFFLLKTPNFWWLFSSLTLSLSLLINALILQNLALKGSKLENELSQKIAVFCKKHSLPFQNIFLAENQTEVFDASLIGTGKNKKIFLNSNLLEKLSEQEIFSVLAHEFGHLKKNHNTKKFLLETLLTLLSFASASLILSLFLPLASTKIIILIFLLLTVFSFLMEIISNLFSQKFELEADTFASQTNGKQNLNSALNKLLQPENTNFWLDLLFSHSPNLEKRLKNLETNQRKTL
ncbi:M48 family metalloprotease [bacterium]|nr:M48 family metalloprotease [bacterium]